MELAISRRVYRDADRRRSDPGWGSLENEGAAMRKSHFEIYDTPKRLYQVDFTAMQGGYIVTVPVLLELAVFGTNLRQARIAAATAIEALVEDLEANGVPVAQRDPVAAGMTETIERIIRMFSGRPGLSDWLDRQRSLYAVSAYAPMG
jgi:predicted RNase H-like HicB family nuclease